MSFAAVTFDCYGTLIDWETGLLGCLAPRLPSLSSEAILSRYAALETEAEAGPYRSYREVLAFVETSLGLPPGPLAESLKTWQPFPDTVAALKLLKKRFKLAILSNIDDELFAHTAKLLQVPFDAVVTAEQMKSYKPKPAHFTEGLKRLALPKERVLHAAQSLYHDAVPAKSLGIASAWVNRQSGRSGATPASAVRADLEFPDMQSLADYLSKENQ